MMPLVAPFSEAFSELIFSGPVQVHLVIVIDPKDSAANDKLDELLPEVALGHRGEVLVVLMPAVESTTEARAFFGVQSHKLPTAVFSDMRAASEEAPRGFQLVLPKGKALTAASLRTFVEQVRASCQWFLRLLPSSHSNHPRGAGNYGSAGPETQRGRDKEKAEKGQAE